VTLTVALLLSLLGTRTGPLPQAQDAQAQATWDALYAKQKAGFDHSVFLAHMAASRTPGRALDIGSGEGRNALLLASQGWDVTGFDISPVAIKLAHEAARQHGVKLTLSVADVDTFDYGVGQWDLVAGMYMHDMITRNARKIVASLKPGGMLVIEGFHKDFNQRGVGGETYGYATNELLQTFNQLRIVYYEETQARPYWLPKAPEAPIVRLAALREAQR
jgi:SAM-dependent methyltransferase